MIYFHGPLFSEWHERFQNCRNIKRCPSGALSFFLNNNSPALNAKIDAQRGDINESSLDVKYFSANKLAIQLKDYFSTGTTWGTGTTGTLESTSVGIGNKNITSVQNNAIVIEAISKTFKVVN